MLFFTREQLTIGYFEANLESVIKHKIEENVTRYRKDEKQVRQQLKHWTNSTVNTIDLIKIVDFAGSENICDVGVKACRI